MRKIVKKTTFWRCRTCGTDYRKKSDAKRCESNPIEQKKFEVGDRVTNSMWLRECLSATGNRQYRFKGRINKVSGPQPLDEEYWNKWLRGCPNIHVFLYEVTYKCPGCGERKKAIYYAPELSKI